MIDYRQLRSLGAVLRTGSFEAAAAELHVTPSAVSQRIKALEERVGGVVVVRGTPCVATALGRRLARHADEVQRLEEDLSREVAALAGGRETVLRIAVNADSLATWFLPALTGQPGLLFDLVIDDQDHSADWLRRGDVAAAVTGHAAPVQGCDCWPLGAMRYVAVASPAFVERWLGADASPEALTRAPAITFDGKDRLQADWLRSVFGRRVGFPTHRIASSQAFVDAALLGIGWGMNPLALVEPHLAAGRLVALVPDRPLDVPLYWQASRIGAGTIAPVSRAVRAAAREALRS